MRKRPRSPFSTRVSVLKTPTCIVLLSFLFTLLFIPSADAQITPRIVGGGEVNPPFRYPWMVALIRSRYASDYLGQYCGGTLIAPDLVVTAGHCVQGVSADSIDVLVGAHDLTNPDENPGNRERIPAAEIFLHELYSSYDLDNDIALIRLEHAAHASLTPLQLISDTLFDEAYNEATVIGWGNTIAQSLSFSEPDYYAERLQEVNIPVVDQETCVSTFDTGWITENMLCAGFASGRKDACSGDSGGPLVILNPENQYELIGLVSWGEGCALPDYYGVYTRVFNYLDWIAQKRFLIEGDDLGGAVSILQILTGIPPSHPEVALDLSGDGLVNLSDAVFALQKAAGLR